MSQGPADRKVVGLVPRMAKTVVEAQRRLDDAFAEEVRQAVAFAADLEGPVGRELAGLLFPSRIDLHRATVETHFSFMEAQSIEAGISLNLFGRPITQFLSGRYEERLEEGARLSLTIAVERRAGSRSNRSDPETQK